MSEKRLLQKVAANDMPSAAHMAGTGETRGCNKKPNRSPASGFDSGRSCDRMSEKRLLQKVAANDMPSAATWRSGWDSNPRALADNLISSFIKCVSGSVSFVFVSASFVFGAKPHKHWLFHAKAPKKPVFSGKFE